MTDSTVDQQVDQDAVENLAPFVEKFMAEVPGGLEGDAEMRRRDPEPFVDVTSADVRLDELSNSKIHSWFDFMAWSLWDVMATRSSEGESGLIPRQEYETVSFVQQRALYPDAVRLITEKIGVEGIIEAGRVCHTTVGSKLNHLRNYSSAMMGCLGRGIAVELGLEDRDSGRQDMVELIQYARRGWHGAWGEGRALASSNGYKLPFLAQEVLDSLVSQVEPLEDPEAMAIFRRFNASTELFGFMLHWDARMGMGDTGPYTLPDGRIALVRDHFLAEDAYDWSQEVIAGMPYAVTEVMVFKPENVRFTLNDIGTTFAEPSTYLDHLDSVAVFAKDTIDTPVSELRKIDATEMNRLAKLSDKGTMQLYRDLSKMSREQKILNGVTMYSHEFIRPMAQFAGVWEEVRSMGFDSLTSLAEQAWPTLTGGEAEGILLPVFLKGNGFPRFTR